MKIKNIIIKFLDLIRYVFGVIIIIGSITDLPSFYGFFGILFGISLFPVIYWKFKTIEKNRDNKKIIKFCKIIQIILPIILFFTWGILLPSEKLKNIVIDNQNNVIGVNQKYEVDFKTNLLKTDKKNFKYQTSNEDIATIDENGVITGKDEGDIILTIIGDNDIEAKANYTIKYINLENIEIIGDTKLAVGTNGILKIKLNPENTSDKNIKWTSSNPKIISIDDNGNIIANAKGTAMITATSEKEITASVKVESYVEVNLLEIKPTSMTIEKGKTGVLTLTILPDTADQNGITWFSSDTNIATVENGVVTGKKSGDVTITAKSVNGKTVNASITINEIYAESINLDKNEISLLVGENANLSATILPSNTTDKGIEWSSSDYKIVDIENGKVTARSHGIATINAYSSNKKRTTAIITVTEKAPIKINNFMYTKDYACGVEWTFSITNNSSKTINYITMKWHNFNAVDDFVYDQIDGKNYTTLKYTGPLKPDANSGSKRNITKFYNCDYDGSTFSEFIIEYNDGTTITISSDDMGNYDDLI
jgi:uncharacterized protein YjdB